MEGKIEKGEGRKERKKGKGRGFEKGRGLEKGREKQRKCLNNIHPWIYYIQTGNKIVFSLPTQPDQVSRTSFQLSLYIL